MSPRLLAVHRWVGVVVGLFIALAAGTALALNHQDLLPGPGKAAAATGPYSRYMLSLAVDPRDARHVLAGTSDGLFRSADGGKTWEDAVLPVPAEQVVGLAEDPAHPGVVYAAFRQTGLYRSEDGGDVWEEVALPFDPATGTTIQALTLAAGVPCLLTPAGLYRQHGATWDREAAAGAQAPERKLLSLVYDLHDGKFWGTWGVPVTDVISLAILGLVLTGYIIFFSRWWRVRRARQRVAA